MKLITRFTLSFLLLAVLPLLIAMGISLWHSTVQTRSLAIDMAQSRLYGETSHLSSYFSERLSEMNAYASMPAIRSMDFAASKPFLLSELKRHDGIYEKFLLGLPSGEYFYSGDGNPALGGLASFNDKDPLAQPKSIRQRDYWQYTVGENNHRERRSYVSNPMISYTTGTKQIVVAATILADDGEILGMLGAALPWTNIEQVIAEVREHLTSKVPWAAKFMLVSPEGVYWYHWNEAKLVQLARNPDGSPVLNEIGEKVSISSRITEETIPELAQAGRQMLAGQEGHAYFTDPATGENEIIIYTPVEPGGYSVAAVIPEKEIMAPVYRLQQALLSVILITLPLVITAAMLLSRRVSKPILKLSKAAGDAAKGDFKPLSIPDTQDEVSDLTQSFNTMTHAVRERESQLRASEERFDRAVRGTSDGLWDWNIHTNEVWYAARMRELLGYSEDEFPPVFASFEDRLHREDHDRVMRSVEEHLQHNKPFDIEYRLRHQSGEYRWFSARGMASRDENGKPLRMSGSIRDITDRKAIQTSLILAKEEAEYSSQAKTQFLSSMSHELRTPLNAILGFGQLLEMGTDNLSKQEMQKYINHIMHSGHHLLGLINEVLDLSRIEAGHLHMQSEPVPLAQAVTECITQIESLAGKYNVKLINDIDDPGLTVLTDSQRIKQVLINLLSNAVKYNRDGGSVRVSSEPVAKARIRIQVSDTGQGIAPEDIHKLFDPFERLSFKNGSIEGSGIGLTVTRQLVEAMDGSIGVESVLNQGSTFWVELPLTAGEDLPVQPETAELPGSQVAALIKHRVLLVEDNPANTELVISALKHTGSYEILSSTTAERGIELAEEERPDIILMDINLPGMDGIAALKVLRSIEITRSIPVIAVSANAMDNDIKAGHEVGFDDYITKPIDILQLYATIEKHLTQSATG